MRCATGDQACWHLKTAHTAVIATLVIALIVMIGLIVWWFTYPHDELAPSQTAIDTESTVAKQPKQSQLS